MTRATTLAELPPAVRAAIREHATAALLELPDSSAAYLTHSERLRKPGLFSRLIGSGDRDAEHLTALVVGPQDALVASVGELRGTAVLHARLEDLEVSDVRTRLQQAGLPVPEDDGIDLTGFPVAGEQGTARGAYFFPLGPPAGGEARDALIEAVRRAKR